MLLLILCGDWQLLKREAEKGHLKRVSLRKDFFHSSLLTDIPSTRDTVDYLVLWCRPRSQHSDRKAEGTSDGPNVTFHTGDRVTLTSFSLFWVPFSLCNEDLEIILSFGRWNSVVNNDELIISRIEFLFTDYTEPLSKNLIATNLTPAPDRFLSGTSHHPSAFELYIYIYTSTFILWTKFVITAPCLSQGKWASCALLLSCLRILGGLVTDLGRSCVPFAPSSRLEWSRCKCWGWFQPFYISISQLFPFIPFIFAVIAVGGGGWGGSDWISLGWKARPRLIPREPINRRYLKDIWASRVDSVFQIILHLIVDTVLKGSVRLQTGPSGSSHALMSLR